MLPDRYTVANLKRSLANPSLIVDEGQRLARNAAYRLNNQLFLSRYGSGIDVCAQDWDNLIILDACRFDYFAQHSSIDGELRAVVSKGSHSSEFIESNFTNNNLADAVYVTANPHVVVLDEQTFYTVENVLTEWDSDLQTVPPEAVVDATERAIEEYPKKRIIAHFMQPHAPYVGPTGDRLREQSTLRGWHKYRLLDEGVESEGLMMRGAAMRGDLSTETLKDAYAENLDIVLDAVESLLPKLEGKTVVTADHGELLGERVTPFTREEYGHPNGILTPKLRFVPWLEIEGEVRRETVTEEPIGYSIDAGKMQERLQALGYVS